MLRDVVGSGSGVVGSGRVVDVAKGVGEGRKKVKVVDSGDVCGKVDGGKVNVSREMVCYGGVRVRKKSVASGEWRCGERVRRVKEEGEGGQ